MLDISAEMNLFYGLQVNIFQSYSETHSSDKNALKLSKNAQKGPRFCKKYPVGSRFADRGRRDAFGPRRFSAEIFFGCSPPCFSSVTTNQRRKAKVV